MSVFGDWLRKLVADDRFYFGEDSPYFPEVGALAQLASQQHESVMRMHALRFGEVQGVVPKSHDCASNDYHLCNLLAAAEAFNEKYG